MENATKQPFTISTWLLPLAIALIPSGQLQYINKEDYDILLDKAKMLSSKIGNFIKTRKTFQS